MQSLSPEVYEKYLHILIRDKEGSITSLNVDTLNIFFSQLLRMRKKVQYEINEVLKRLEEGEGEYWDTLRGGLLQIPSASWIEIVKNRLLYDCPELVAQSKILSPWIQPQNDKKDPVVDIDSALSDTVFFSIYSNRKDFPNVNVWSYFVHKRKGSKMVGRTVRVIHGLECHLWRKLPVYRLSDLQGLSISHENRIMVLKECIALVEAYSKGKALQASVTYKVACKAFQRVQKRIEINATLPLGLDQEILGVHRIKNLGSLISERNTRFHRMFDASVQHAFLDKQIAKSEQEYNVVPISAGEMGISPDVISKPTIETFSVNHEEKECWVKLIQNPFSPDYQEKLIKHMNSVFVNHGLGGKRDALVGVYADQIATDSSLPYFCVGNRNVYLADRHINWFSIEVFKQTNRLLAKIPGILCEQYKGLMDPEAIPEDIQFSLNSNVVHLVGGSLSSSTYSAHRDEDPVVACGCHDDVRVGKHTYMADGNNMIVATLIVTNAKNMESTSLKYTFKEKPVVSIPLGCTPIKGVQMFYHIQSAGLQAEGWKHSVVSKKHSGDANIFRISCTFRSVRNAGFNSRESVVGAVNTALNLGFDSPKSQWGEVCSEYPMTEMIRTLSGCEEVPLIHNHDHEPDTTVVPRKSRKRKLPTINTRGRSRTKTGTDTASETVKEKVMPPPPTSSDECEASLSSPEETELSEDSSDDEWESDVSSDEDSEASSNPSRYSSARKKVPFLIPWRDSHPNCPKDSLVSKALFRPVKRTGLKMDDVVLFNTRWTMARKHLLQGRMVGVRVVKDGMEEIEYCFHRLPTFDPKTCKTTLHFAKRGQLFYTYKITSSACLSQSNRGHPILDTSENASSTGIYILSESYKNNAWNILQHIESLNNPNNVANQKFGLTALSENGCPIEIYLSGGSPKYPGKAFQRSFSTTDKNITFCQILEGQNMSTPMNSGIRKAWERHKVVALFVRQHNFFRKICRVMGFRDSSYIKKKMYIGKTNEKETAMFLDFCYAKEYTESSLSHEEFVKEHSIFPNSVVEQSRYKMGKHGCLTMAPVLSDNDWQTVIGLQDSLSDYIVNDKRTPLCETGVVPTYPFPTDGSHPTRDYIEDMYLQKLEEVLKDKDKDTNGQMNIPNHSSKYSLTKTSRPSVCMDMRLDVSDVCAIVMLNNFACAQRFFGANVTSIQKGSKRMEYGVPLTNSESVQFLPSAMRLSPTRSGSLCFDANFLFLRDSVMDSGLNITFGSRYVYCQADATKEIHRCFGDAVYRTFLILFYGRPFFYASFRKEVGEFNHGGSSATIPGRSDFSLFREYVSLYGWTKTTKSEHQNVRSRMMENRWICSIPNGCRTLSGCLDFIKRLSIALKDTDLQSTLQSNSYNALHAYLLRIVKDCCPGSPGDIHELSWIVQKVLHYLDMMIEHPALSNVVNPIVMGKCGGIVMSDMLQDVCIQQRKIVGESVNQQGPVIACGMCSKDFLLLLNLKVRLFDYLRCVADREPGALDSIGLSVSREHSFTWNINNAPLQNVDLEYILSESIYQSRLRVMPNYAYTQRPRSDLPSSHPIILPERDDNVERTTQIPSDFRTDRKIVKSFRTAIDSYVQCCSATEVSGACYIPEWVRYAGEKAAISK